MRARVPLDVDLEDRLVYGLTPLRLCYAVLAVLAAMAVWSQAGVAIPLRVALVAVVAGCGAALAWGRWRGRAADAWVVDVVLFVWSTRRVKWHGP